MPHRSIYFIQTVCWVFCALFAFLFVMELDEEAPIQLAGILSVTTVDQGASAPQTREALAEYAVEHEITVGQIVSGFDGDTINRDLYLISADPAVDGDQWLDGGYRDFSQSVDTTVRPYDESVTLPVTAGLFVVFGDMDKTQQLQEGMSELGMGTVMVDAWSPSALAAGLGGQEMTETTLMMLLVVVAVLGAGVLNGVRAYGVMRLQGQGFWGIYAGALRTTARAWATAGTAVLLIALVALYLYNQLAAIGVFLAATAALEATFLLVSLLVHGLALAVAMRAPILASVKGEMRGYLVSAAVHVLRLTAAVSLVAMLAAAVAGLADLRQRDDAVPAYAAASDWQGLSLAWPDSEEEANQALGSWLRASDRNGDVLIARKSFLQSEDDSLNFYPALTVNDQFLEEQLIVDANGGRVTGASLGEAPTVLIPSDLWDRRSDILETGVATAVDEAGQVAMMESQTEQSVFTYSDWNTSAYFGEDVSDQSYMMDPIVVYAPSSSGIISDGNYTAYATLGLWVRSEAVTQALLTDPGVQKYVQAATPADAQFAKEFADVTRDWRITMIGVVAGFTVLVVTAIGATLVFCRRGAQRIFARHTAGWRLVSTYRSLLCLEAGVLAIALGWIPYQVSQHNRDVAIYKEAGMAAMWAEQHVSAGEWLGMLLLGVISTGALTITLLAIHRRIVQAGASEG